MAFDSLVCFILWCRNIAYVDTIDYKTQSPFHISWIELEYDYRSWLWKLESSCGVRKFLVDMILLIRHKTLHHISYTFRLILIIKRTKNRLNSFYTNSSITFFMLCIQDKHTGLHFIKTQSLEWKKIALIAKFDFWPMS